MYSRVKTKRRATDSVAETMATIVLNLVLSGFAMLETMPGGGGCKGTVGGIFVGSTFIMATGTVPVSGKEGLPRMNCY